MSKRKIFNDPIYGFISYPDDFIYDLIDHPFFQRLRRINQLGLTHYVYPGARHSRFQHALGAVHLTTRAIRTLRLKGVDISDEEARATSIAVLLHDIGHGPFSHALEYKIVPIAHETISMKFMAELDRQFDGRLTQAIRIFEGSYPKRFLHQLVSGQLDMDRMDYLNRDSFFTGVAEGVIGYDRIIEMLDVADDRLVVEEKGIHSIEKFIMSRRIMYWQVYLHKTVLAVEKMLIRFFERLHSLVSEGAYSGIPAYLDHFISRTPSIRTADDFSVEDLENYAKLDDTDIIATLKQSVEHSDFQLRYLARCLLERKIFRVLMQKAPFTSDHLAEIRHKVGLRCGVEPKVAEALMIIGSESNTTYSTKQNEIYMLLKNGAIIPLSQMSDHLIGTDMIVRYFLCYPKIKF